MTCTLGQDHREFGETDKSSESAEALLVLALSIGNKGYAMMVRQKSAIGAKPGCNNVSFVLRYTFSAKRCV